MLCNWQQPKAVCRLGLLHSAYSNSFVSMNCFDPNTDRERVRGLIGEEAENLVYKFCSIDRQFLEQTVLGEGTIRRDGYVLTHIHTGAPLAVSGAEAAAFVTETLADEADQRFGWQTDLERGATAAVWPGPSRTTATADLLGLLVFCSWRNQCSNGRKSDCCFWSRLNVFVRFRVYPRATAGVHAAILTREVAPHAAPRPHLAAGARPARLRPGPGGQPAAHLRPCSQLPGPALNCHGRRGDRPGDKY